MDLLEILGFLNVIFCQLIIPDINGPVDQVQVLIVDPVIGL